ncbi:hypothetical protein [Pantoea allii]|uniref:hypothetical protein n=1 Tax=Pantoea allii TaxID=574096 RepID=UPI0024B826FC|nr:hypothetical protein [Pantoea allii]MDJ0087718.1 hypothetical protein [Pantoea allii]
MEIRSCDIDPYVEEMTLRFQKAMSLKGKGLDEEIEELLLRSTNPPSIYHGHYRELFIIWRKRVKEYIKERREHDAVVLLTNMLSLNEEMIDEMCRYWGQIHQVEITAEYFMSYSKITKTDLANLKKCALACGEDHALEFAENYRYIK